MAAPADADPGPAAPPGTGVSDDLRPGADCFYAEILGQPVCTVHCMYAPCDKAGQPASTVPVHVGDDSYERPALLEVWRATTGGWRPLVIHRGGAIQDGEHRIDGAGSCWCAPETVRPDPVTR